MISSQQAKPPPRSLVHHHHPLRGVITTTGAAPLFVPEIVAVTLNASVCVRSTCVVSRAFPPCRAQSARKGASSPAICRTGGPKGRRKLSALLGQNPGRAPRVTTTIASCRFCRRASPNTPVSEAFGGLSVNPMAASLLRVPIGPAMPAVSVKPPSNNGSPSILRSSTTTDALTGLTRLSENSASVGSRPISRTSLASHSPDLRSTAVPVRWKPCCSYARMTVPMRCCTLHSSSRVGTSWNEAEITPP